MKENIVKVILAAITAGMLTVFGGWDVMLKALLIMMALDITSGFVRAFVQQKLSSKESFRGVGKKFLILVIVAVAVQADSLAGTSGILRDAVVVFYSVSEALSIIENAVAAGLPVPEVLKKALAQLNPDKLGELASKAAASKTESSG